MAGLLMGRGQGFNHMTGDGSVMSRAMLARQVEQATNPDGTVDQDRLAGLMADAYAETAEQARREAARLHVVLENMAQGVCFFDGAECLITCNRRYAEIYGLDLENVRQGTPLREIVAGRHRAGTDSVMSPDEYLKWRGRIATSGNVHESTMELRNGKVIAIRHQPMPGGGWVATHEDITERRRAERHAAFIESHDSLTGLPNQILLGSVLQQTLDRASKTMPCVLLLIHLEGLRRVNGAVGRSAGNDLIRKVADRLRLHVGDDGFLARQGGAEFALVGAGSGQPDAAYHLAARVLRPMEEPFELNGQPVVVGATMGIAVAADPALDPETLVRNATTALQRAKSEAIGSFRVFAPEMNEAAQARRLLERDLRDAVAVMDFELNFQPQVCLNNNRVTGFEALLRWRHKVRGNVPPCDFIPLAEELGLIGAIGQWVLREACREAARWPDEISVAVNVSPVQFNTGDLPQVVAAALREAGLPPTRLELEITETVMMDRNEGTLAALHELRACGIRVAIDDFGIGYSSLAYLPSFPFDKLKIDRSFVSGRGRPRDRDAIVRAIIGLCASLGMNCTAEGVETEEHLAALVREHCPEAQGYLFAKPMPAHEIDDLLQRMNPPRGFPTTAAPRVRRSAATAVI